MNWSPHWPASAKTLTLVQGTSSLRTPSSSGPRPRLYRPRLPLSLSDSSPVPVLLYSVPAFTGLSFPPALAAALAAHPRILGMKESSGDLSLLGRIIAAVPSSFEVACGNAPVLYPALCIGANAGILATSCCAPGPTSALYRAFVAGDHARARRLQDALTPLALAVTVTHGVAGLKVAIDLAGLRGGHVRAPLLPAPEAVRGELAGLLARAEEAARDLSGNERPPGAPAA